MKMTKILKISNFQKFYAFLSKLLTDFGNWNVEKGHQGKNVLSSMLRKEENAVVQRKIVRNRHGKAKIRKFSDFHYFGQFLSKYQ